MGTNCRIAVIIARNDPSTPGISQEAVRAALLTMPNGVLRYWQDATENWFSFPTFDVFGPFDVNLQPPPSARQSIIDTARAAAGADLSGYDNVVVILAPGRALAENPSSDPLAPPLVPTGYDAGANGMGPGSAAVLPSVETHTFFAHEIGHLLGFDHSWGLLNHGVDYGHTGAQSNVYGDPYDIMSASSFGDSSPVFQLPAAAIPAEFSGLTSAGPGAARALVHFYMPLALESVGRVRHVQTAEEVFVLLHPAGSRLTSQPELIVWHPAGEDAAGRGRVYVEYRQFFQFAAGTRWDQGLATTGDDRTRAGIVVHTVRNASGSDQAVLWYAGRITFPTVDTDILIDTDHGKVRVSIDPANATEGPPGIVRVTVSAIQNTARLWLDISESDTKVVLSSEKRPIPGWEFAGTFTWEKRGVSHSMQLAPMTAGLGLAPTDAADTVAVNWKVAGQLLDPAAASVSMNITGRPATLAYKIDVARRSLSLTSNAADGAYSVQITAEASEPSTHPIPLTASATFVTVGVEEGWGDDYQRFMAFIQRITHPKPKPRIGIPIPEQLPNEQELMRADISAVETVNQHAGQVMRSMLSEATRVQVQPVMQLLR
jgi:hypothetical protein